MTTDPNSAPTSPPAAYTPPPSADLTDAQLVDRHGDHSKWSIALWRQEIRSQTTALDYIDWRADKLWGAARDQH